MSAKVWTCGCGADFCDAGAFNHHHEGCPLADAMKPEKGEVERRIAEAVAAEREACAKIADAKYEMLIPQPYCELRACTAQAIAAAIRARSDPPKPNQALVHDVEAGPTDGEHGKILCVRVSRGARQNEADADTRS